MVFLSQAEIVLFNKICYFLSNSRVKKIFKQNYEGLYNKYAVGDEWK